MLRAPHRRVTTRHVPPSRRGLHVIPSHPIPSHPTHIHTTSRSRALTTRQKTPSRIPSVPLCPGCLRGGMGMGGVRTHESRPVNQCTHAHRRMTRGLTRDVMTTDTENHTSTTTIASSRALDSTARFFHLASTSTSRPLARAPPVGMDTVRDGTRRRIDLATRRRRRRRIRSRIAIASTRRRASPTTAFERIHCIRAFFPRIFARIHSSDARAHSSRARRERRGVDVERDREGETRARCVTGRGARATRREAWDAGRETRDERFLPGRGKNEFQFK